MDYGNREVEVTTLAMLATGALVYSGFLAPRPVSTIASVGEKGTVPNSQGLGGVM